jgi:hypothetical protein
MRTFLAFATIVMLVMLNLGGSCASDKTSDKNGERVDDPDRPNRIPEMADVVAEGHEKVKWAADMDGEIWVFDRDKNNIRYTGPIRRGEEVIIQPETDKIYVGGHVVFYHNLEKHSWHKIYFVPGRETEGAPR